MAVYTKDGQLTYVDEQGNEYQLFPKTKIPNVEGLETALAGKAPEGYGLGTAKWISDGRSIDTLTENGWYGWSSGGITGFPFATGYLLVIGRNKDKFVTQFAFNATYSGIGDMQIMTRTYGTDSWSAWAWVDPPMNSGYEYLTTERIDGKAVYKRFNDGVLQYRLDGDSAHKNYSELMGAAPAGYGLGSVAGADKWNGDANALTKQGWYRLESGTTNGVGASASVRVDGYAETGLTQTAYTRTGFVLQRTCVDGTWGEWEYVNPPVQPGVEYRTTERCMGKPVYTQLVDCLTLKTGGTRTVNYVGGTNVIRFSGYADKFALPYMPGSIDGSGNIYHIVPIVENNVIHINAGSSISPYHAYVQVWYIK